MAAKKQAKAKAAKKTLASARKPKKTASKSKAPAKAAKAKPAAHTAKGNGDWRGEMLEQMRALIVEADPEMVEERKWVKPTKPLGVPTWSHAGLVCTGETYKDVIKLTFARGAALADPARLFNSGLGGGTRRAIDIPEGTKIDPRAFKALIKAAVAENIKAKQR